MALCQSPALVVCSERFSRLGGLSLATHLMSHAATARSHLLVLDEAQLSTTSQGPGRGLDELLRDELRAALRPRE